MTTSTSGSNLRSQLPKAENVTKDIVFTSMGGGSDPLNAVSRPTTIYKRLNENWKMTRALMGGTKTMRECRESFLPKEQAETNGSYDNRLARSVLFNAYRKTVETSSGRPFSRPIQFEQFGERLLELNDNIDLLGNNIDVFARTWFRTALAHSNAYALIDYPTRPDLKGEQNETPTLEQERTLGLRPYWRVIEPWRVIGWKTTVIGGLVVPTQVRIAETVHVASGEFDMVETECVRVLDPGFFRVYRRDVRTGRWELVDRGTYLDSTGSPLSFIPLVNFIAGEELGFMEATPKLEDLAHLNILHWQSQSDQQNILHVARVPILFGQGFHDDDDLSIGSSRWVKGPEGSDLRYVEHSGKAIEAGRVSLEDLENQMRIMGAEILVRDPAKVTATQKIIDTDEALSDLENAVVRFEDALSQAYAVTAQWMGEPVETAVGDIAIFKDFGISANAFQESNVLLQARLSKQISQTTFLVEMKRRGIISDDVDIEAEISATDSELSDTMRDDA